MAVTISSQKWNTDGVLRQKIYHISSGWADADTITTPFKHVESASWSFNDADTVAADSVSPEILARDTTNSFARVRLQLAGTARAGTLTVSGW